MIKRDERALDELIEIVYYQDTKLLLKYIRKPLVKIVALIQGALSLGRPEAVKILGRVFQGAILGKKWKQLGNEMKDLIDENIIDKNFGESNLGAKSFIELLDHIDSEIPDEDKFNAMKALFYSVISADISEKEQILNYQLFQIAKNLTSNQLLILVNCNMIVKNKKTNLFGGQASAWYSTVADFIGHKVSEIVAKEEDILTNLKLITPRGEGGNRNYIDGTNARLTSLGLKLCQNLEKYDFKEMMGKTNKT